MKHLIFTLGSAVIVYLLVAFVAAEIDFLKWSEARRVVLVLSFLIIQGCYYMIQIQETVTPKSK